MPTLLQGWANFISQYKFIILYFWSASIICHKTEYYQECCACACECVRSKIFYRNVNAANVRGEEENWENCEMCSSTVQLRRFAFELNFILQKFSKYFMASWGERLSRSERHARKTLCRTAAAAVVRFLLPAAPCFVCVCVCDIV